MRRGPLMAGCLTAIIGVAGITLAKNDEVTTIGALIGIIGGLLIIIGLILPDEKPPTAKP